MLPSHFEEGKEKCPYDPARGYTGLIVGKQHLSRAGGDMQDATDHGPIPSTSTGGASWVVPHTEALANQDLVLPLLVCLGLGDAGGLWGCPQAAGPC